MRKRIAFFEKMDKIDKSLAGSLRKKRYINTQNGGGEILQKIVLWFLKAGFSNCIDKILLPKLF